MTNTTHTHVHTTTHTRTQHEEVRVSNEDGRVLLISVLASSRWEESVLPRAEEHTLAVS